MKEYQEETKKKKKNILGLIKPDFKNILKILNILLAYNIKTWKYTTLKCKAWWFSTKWTHMSSSVQSLSRVWLFATPCQPSLSLTNSWSLPKLLSIELVMPSNYLILCHPLVQSIGVSASTSVLPMNTQDWSPWGWTSWISLLSKGLSRIFSNTTIQKHRLFSAQLSLQSNSHIHT